MSGRIRTPRLRGGVSFDDLAGSGPSLPPSYFELVNLFPLIRIRDEGHLTLALKMINKLLRSERDEGAEAYLSVLTDLVETYEDEHEPAPEASEADVLASLMEANGLSQRGLAGRVGIAQSTISAVLQGKRALTRGQIEALADSFGLTPAAFIGG